MRGAAQNLFERLLIEPQLVGEDPQMLGVGDFRAPEFAGEIAAPDAAPRRKGLHHLPAGVVHVAAGVALTASGRNER